MHSKERKKILAQLLGQTDIYSNNLNATQTMTVLRVPLSGWGGGRLILMAFREAIMEVDGF